MQKVKIIMRERYCVNETRRDTPQWTTPKRDLGEQSGNRANEQGKSPRQTKEDREMKDKVYFLVDTSSWCGVQAAPVGCIGLQPGGASS